MLRIHLDGKLGQNFPGAPPPSPPPGRCPWTPLGAAPPHPCRCSGLPRGANQLVSLRSTNNPPTFSNLDPPLLVTQQRAGRCLQQPKRVSAKGKQVMLQQRVILFEQLAESEEVQLLIIQWLLEIMQIPDYRCIKFLYYLTEGNLINSKTNWIVITSCVVINFFIWWTVWIVVTMFIWNWVQNFDNFISDSSMQLNHFSLLKQNYTTAIAAFGSQIVGHWQIACICHLTAT